jgi:hypothetical protein
LSHLVTELGRGRMSVFGSIGQNVKPLQVRDVNWLLKGAKDSSPEGSCPIWGSRALPTLDAGSAQPVPATPIPFSREARQRIPDQR